MRLLGLLGVALCLLASAAHSGQNPNYKIAVHIEALNSKRTCDDLPVIEYCYDIMWTYIGCGDVDVFPVYFDLYGFTAIQYRLVWPEEWGSGVHNHCADLCIGDIRRAGDAVALAWRECQIYPCFIPGWISLTATTPGKVKVEGWDWEILITDCNYQEDEPFLVFDGGICGMEGDATCGHHAYWDLSKVDDVGGGCIAAGQPISYSIAFGNPWINPNAYNVVVVDELPAECTFLEASDGGAYNDTSHSVTWAIGRLLRGERDTVEVSAVVDAGVQPGGILDNYCEIFSHDHDVIGKHCLTEVCGRVPVELSVSAAFQGDCLAPEGDILYELSYGTPGQQADIHNVVLVDTLSTCLEISWATEGHMYDPYGRTISWDLGTLAPDTQASVQIGARATWDCTAGGAIRNICAISSDETDAARASVLTQVCDFGPIGLVKTDDVGTGCIHPGDSIAYIISYHNLQAEDFHDVVLTDNLHAAVVFVSASGSGGYDPGSHAITWTLGLLPAGSGDSVSAVVEVREDYIYQYCIENTCQIVSAETEPASAVLRTYLCGTYREGKAAVHVLPRDASRSCTENFPQVDFCEDIRSTEAACEVDFFPVFFGLDEFRGFEYGLTWPAEWGSISFVSCSDIAVGEVVQPGDGIVQTWSECRTGNLTLTGYGRIDATGPGLIEVVAHPEFGGPKVVTCRYGSYDAIMSFKGGVCGAVGDEPCPTGPQDVRPVTWGAIKAMFK